MGWKLISKLHQINIPSKEYFGEFINVIKDSKNTYVQELTTGMSQQPSNYINKKNQITNKTKTEKVMVNIHGSISLFSFYPNYLHRLGKQNRYNIGTIYDRSLQGLLLEASLICSLFQQFIAYLSFFLVSTLLLESKSDRDTARGALNHTKKDFPPQW